MQRSWVNGQGYARLTAMETLARLWVAHASWLKNMVRTLRLAMSSTNTSRLVRVCLICLFLIFLSLALLPRDDQKTPSTEISLTKTVFPESLFTLILSLSLRIVFAPTLIAFTFCSSWDCHCISRCYKNSHHLWCPHAPHHSDSVLLRPP